MLEQFYPKEYLDSTYIIDFEKMYEMGYRGIIFDIDNTLVPHGEPADERSIFFFRYLKKIGVTKGIFRSLQSLILYLPSYKLPFLQSYRYPNLR